MNPEKPSREEIEAKLTALLLGELPAEEAQLLRWAVSQDAALAKLHDRLKLTIGFVREVAVNPAEASPAQTEPLKLSGEKREKLLAHFKTVRPIVFLPPLKKSRDISPFLAMAAALALVAVLAAMLLPALASAKRKAQNISAMNEAKINEMDARLAAENATATPPPASPSAESERRVDGLEAHFQNANPSGAKGALTQNVGDAWKNQTKIVLPPSGTEDKGLAAASPAPSGGETETRVFNLKYGSPTETANELGAIFQSSGNNGNRSPSGLAGGYANASNQQQVKAVANPRTQSVIVTAAKDEMPQIQNMIAQMDVNSKRDQNAYTVHLENASPTEVLKALGKTFPSGNNSPSGASQSQSDLLTTRQQQMNSASSSSSGFAPAQSELSLAYVSPENEQKIAAAANAAVKSRGGFGGRGGSGGGGGGGEFGGGGRGGSSAGLVGNWQTRSTVTVSPPPVETLGIPGSAGGMENSTVSGEVAVDDTGAQPSDGNGRFYRSTTPYSGADQKSKMPMLGDIPVTGNLFQSSQAKQSFYDDNYSTTANRPSPGTGGSSPSLTVPASTANPLGQFPGGTASSVAPSETERESSTLVQDGKLLYEAGKLQESEAKLQDALKKNPNSEAAFYYLNLDQQARFDRDKRAQQTASRAATTPPPPVAQNPMTTRSQLPSATAEDRPLPKTPSPAPIPQPEILTGENAFSTFSLNVSDVSFKLAAASLQKNVMPDAASIRSEEFINAFDYRDPEPLPGVPVAFVAERARDPFAHNRDLLRFSIKTAAAGREAGRPLNIVLLLDNSGSMERADRVAIIHEALKVLASELQPQDTLSIVTFARTARLWVDGARGDQAGTAVNEVSNLTPGGGTNLEEAMNLAYATARRHYLANGVNRVVLLTDGAANLGNVDPDALKQKVESFRKQGIALDCFGIGWEGYNDDLLEVLSSNGDGRYGFINTPEEAKTEFAAQLAGALHVAAEDVKVQVEFNPQRVVSWRQIGYAKHQLTKEQFRDNTVAAAPMAAREAGNALYTVEVNPQGDGPIATVRVRFRVPGTTDVSEHEWQVPFDGTAPALENASAAMRLASVAAEFSEWLASSPFAQEVTPGQLLNYLNGVPQIYGADPRPKQLETMIREAQSLSGK